MEQLNNKIIKCQMIHWEVQAAPFCDGAIAKSTIMIHEAAIAVQPLLAVKSLASFGQTEEGR
jgi:hypothetical protein